jgi:hypothetical protein
MLLCFASIVFLDVYPNKCTKIQKPSSIPNGVSLNCLSIPRGIDSRYKTPALTDIRGGKGSSAVERFIFASILYTFRW